MSDFNNPAGSVIRVLDENTANQIAAGEVVERPAAVVKELVENSIDAGATNIEIEIEEGGLKFIRVSDNGVGMSLEDVQLAVRRHATSKIQTVDDLYKINTLGFRGEALPSIAAVSKFTVTTRQQKDDFATLAIIEGGLTKDIREAGAGLGTTVTVSDIFFNTPARRKFLKTATAESGHISEIVGKLAISHPKISFKLINNQRVTLQTNGNGKLLSVLENLYGPKAGQDVLLIHDSQDGSGTSDVSVKGYIAKPTLLKSSRTWQTFIVNERVISSRMLFKAVDNAYFSLLPKGGYPLVVLIISIDAEVIDVNVHPQKKEIKFSDEQKVFRTVYKGIINALANKSPEVNEKTLPVVYSDYRPRLEDAAKVKTEPVSIPVATLDNNKNTKFPKNVKKPGKYENNNFQPELALNDKTETKDNDSYSLIEAQKLLTGEEMFSTFFEKKEKNTDTCQENEDAAGLYPLGQIDACYIVAYKKGGGGLYIIDQHAAHERILYNRLSQNLGTVPSQQLLIPIMLDFPPADCEAIETHKTVFKELGFDFEQIGPGIMRLLEIPADIPADSVESIVRQTLTMIGDLSQPTAQALRHAYLQTASCRAAVKSGDILTMRQMQALIGELGHAASPYTCPHGRPTTVKFTLPELDKMFKRT